MNRRTLLPLLTLVILINCDGRIETQEVERWGVFELVLDGPDTGNPYMEVELSAVFVSADDTIAVPGFYDGDGTYKIRFSPDATGVWRYRTNSNANELANKEGTLECTAASTDNHGPVTVYDTHYLRYADGTPFFPVGTTAYQWTSVKPEIQRQTIESLAKSPFNKIRMCFFPKSYQYGNDTEPFRYPFKRDGEQNDFTQPDYAFFRNFDEKVRALDSLGVEADVILFHPYDHWGYCSMGDDFNEKYVRYMIARLSAFRNVWWSLANEWDVPSIKDSIDWEGIGVLLMNEDPHQRLRGIHNWYNSEDHFYDHTRPWITHVSAQTSQFYNAIKWREQYKKPLLFDEMRYEGDVPSGWGNMDGQEMTSYFWMAALSGGYGTHGETFTNSSDDSTEVRWWAKGGVLVGESPERIQFFRDLIEKQPYFEMSPVELNALSATDIDANVYIFSKPGKYMAYAPGGGQSFELSLSSGGPYQLEIVDTWNMNVLEQRTVEAGAFQYRSDSPYTLLILSQMNAD